MARTQSKQALNDNDGRAQAPVLGLIVAWPSTRNSAFGLRNSSRLPPTGMAGFVVANSGSDVRTSEQEIRRMLIESRR